MTDNDRWDEASSGQADDSEYWSAEPAVLSDREAVTAVRRGGRIAIALIAAFVVLAIVILGVRALSSLTIPEAPGALGVLPSSTPHPTVRPTASTAHASTVAPTPIGKAAEITSVVDGDTIHVSLEGADETVRIIGLDSPESKKPGTPVECFAAEATKAAKRLLHPGQKVTLQEDPTQDTRDQYGRLLAHVILEDGALFAEQMIRDGYAVHYIYDGVPSIYADRLAAAQAAAESAEAGLWSPATCAGDPHAASKAPA